MLKKDLGVEDEPVILLTYHPSHEKSVDENYVDFTTVLSGIMDTPFNIIITYPNNDPGGEKILVHIKLLEDIESEKIKIIPNLGTDRMLSLFKHFKTIVVGNSSGAITETTLYCVPAINLGDRQTDRFCGENIFNCTIDAEKIKSTLLYIEENYSPLQKQFKRTRNFFGQGDAAVRIKKHLEKFLREDTKRLLFKKFIVCNTNAQNAYPISSLGEDYHDSSCYCSTP
jgi:UDP-N-acetylglucosamine 2-epimerase